MPFKDRSQREQVRRLLLEAAALLSGDQKLTAGNVTSPDRNNAMVVMVPLPKYLADRFPGPEYNNGHVPHLTVCFLTADDIPPGKAQDMLAALRRICKRQAPFRVGLDVANGLQDFGLGARGSKSLWFGVRQDPDFAVDRLHHAIRQCMQQENLPCEHQKGFQPHITWRYVDNGQSESERQRMSALAVSRFDDVRTWFDVRQLVLSMPDGSEKLIALSPRLR